MTCRSETVTVLKGRNVNLRVMERDDVDFLVECRNNTDYDRYDPMSPQTSKTERTKEFDNPPQLSTITETARFIVEKKDGKKIGNTRHWLAQPNRTMEIGHLIIPSERGKGHGTEAVQIIVDYLFLSRDIPRIQAMTNVENKASHRVLEKTGFKKEGTVRKSAFVRGEWANAYLYSILREEWKKPKILAKTVSKN
jgi:RimJ/RimL family protein N-acetyltransferase